MPEATRTKFAKLEKIDKHVVKATYLKQDGKVREKQMEEIFSDASKLVELDPKKIYLVNGIHTFLSKNGRLLIAAESQNWNKIAIHIHNLAQRIIANNIIKIKKGNNEIKLFTKEEEALNWLKKENYSLN
jgi:hypothetical protein